MRRSTLLAATALLPPGAGGPSAAPPVEAITPALSSIKTLLEDPAAVEKIADEIKARYQRIFKV